MWKGKKVILECIDEENIEQMRQWRNDPERRQYFREWKDITKPMQKAWFDERGCNKHPQHVYFQIMSYREDASGLIHKNLIGCCGLHYIDWRLRCAEFGIFIAQDLGQGKGKEALELLCNYGFWEMNLHKIWCEVYDNNSSIELYRSLGFKDEGMQRHTYFNKGQYGNSYLLSVLESEWPTCPSARGVPRERLQEAFCPKT